MTLDDQAMDLIFRKARTQNGWQDKPVSDAQLKALYELMKWGPTTANTQPGRLLFLRTRESKERLKPHLSPSNQDKTMAAPAVAIIAYDLEFYEQIPRLFPHKPEMKNVYAGEEKKAFVETTALRNSSLQGAYLMIAARAQGLDCGPMSGFNNAAVDKEFFAGTSYKSNFICSLGHGDPAKVMQRLPRLEFDEVCKLL
jgi:3-hydroxypropanoate dehydrogenase